MASQGTVWFCHECHSEMIPLMVPDPICASCHGTFVEKMENPSDDPRHFTHDDIGLGDNIPLGMDAFLRVLRS
jgi:E3 ubiquitin-protein ligase RNF115/126